MSGEMSSTDKDLDDSSPVIATLEVHTEEKTLEVMGGRDGESKNQDQSPGEGDDRAPCGVDQDALLVQDRDPYHWHDQVKIRFEDIFGEPDVEVHSFDSVWHTSNKIFTLSKYWCYRITSLILAVPLAVLWGVGFGCVTFTRIWCCVPCLKSCDIEMHCARRLCEVTLRSCVAPCFEAAGRMFYHIRLRVIRGDNEIA